MLIALHDEVRHAPSPLPGDLGCPGPLTVGSAHGCLLCRRWNADWGVSEPGRPGETRPKDQSRRLGG